jgi:hypothetical protein
MLFTSVIPGLHQRAFLFRLLMCLLVCAVAFAVTRARLSQYEPVHAPTGVMAKSTKVAECRFVKLEPAAVQGGWLEESPLDHEARYQTVAGAEWSPFPPAKTPFFLCPLRT